MLEEEPLVEPVSLYSTQFLSTQLKTHNLMIDSLRIPGNSKDGCLGILKIERDVLGSYGFYKPLGISKKGIIGSLGIPRGSNQGRIGSLGITRIPTRERLNTRDHWDSEKGILETLI